MHSHSAQWTGTRAQIASILLAVREVASESLSGIDYIEGLSSTGQPGFLGPAGLVEASTIYDDGLSVIASSLSVCLRENGAPGGWGLQTHRGSMRMQRGWHPELSTGVTTFQRASGSCPAAPRALPAARRACCWRLECAEDTLPSMGLQPRGARASLHYPVVLSRHPPNGSSAAPLLRARPLNAPQPRHSAATFTQRTAQSLPPSAGGALAAVQRPAPLHKLAKGAIIVIR
jgi:hypothetical protein